MSLFEFLMVLVSIIIGLGVAEVLTGIARQFRTRGSTQRYSSCSNFLCPITAVVGNLGSTT